LKLLKILRPNPRQNSGRIVVGRILENGGQGGARVFGVEIDLTAEQSLMRQQRASQVQAALDSPMKPMFQMLRDDFS